MRSALLASFGVFAVLYLAVLPVSAAPASAGWSLLPHPAQARLAEGPATEIANGSAIAVRGADRRQLLNIAAQFVQLVADTRGLQLHMAQATDAHPAITFEVDAHADVEADAGYRIVVDDRGVLLRARTPQGLFYGSVTVWQLLT